MCEPCKKWDIGWYRACLCECHRRDKMGMKKVIVEIRGTEEDKKQVLRACLEKMECDDIGEVVRQLTITDLCKLARKVHGAMYSKMGDINW